MLLSPVLRKVLVEVPQFSKQKPLSETTQNLQKIDTTENLQKYLISLLFYL
jgi:hypothetical protein